MNAATLGTPLAPQASPTGGGPVAPGELKGRVCVVTGAAERVGRILALRLADEGMNLVVNHCQQPELAAQVVTAATNLGVEAIAVDADVSLPQTGPELVRQVHERFGRIDVLVHNASNFVQKPFGDVRPEDFDLSLGVNLRGPFFISQAVGRYMFDQGHGKIFAMVGNSYYEAWPDFAAHACAKVALAKLMQILAIQYAPVVQANAVCPARILPSPAGQDIHIAGSRGENPQQQPQGVTLADTTADDVAEVLVRLCGMPAGFTGVVLPIDGGKSVL